jgi:hypothetical protein
MGTLSFNEYKNINKNNRHKHVYLMSIKCFNIKYFLIRYQFNYTC